ncbi:hypothetical protein [Rummeliibacillus stabekisii]|uniref:Uncharacterized protein n=1 Tax=Rummeliibacillus stabekisii TaxID=241244 RepID=A0A143H928_9BACL|nr:hypothetical protein [Rummeliibacillus stabekisii]AMW97949.1 hypothetical protein ATY39_00110 [Rummeliibacillus stabekisii]
MEEIFVKEWFSKQLRQIFHVYPQASNIAIEVIDLNHPVLEQYMQLIQKKWRLRLATSAFVCIYHDAKDNQWEATFICKKNSVLFELWKKNDEVIAYETYK